MIVYGQDFEYGDETNVCMECHEGILSFCLRSYIWKKAKPYSNFAI